MWFVFVRFVLVLFGSEVNAARVLMRGGRRLEERRGRQKYRRALSWWGGCAVTPPKLVVSGRDGDGCRAGEPCFVGSIIYDGGVF